jgi:hypothetical protein
LGRRGQGAKPGFFLVDGKTEREDTTSIIGEVSADRFRNLTMTYSMVRWVILVAQIWLGLTLAAQIGHDGGQQKLEKERLEVEKTRIEGDLRLREEELKLKREELELKKKGQEQSGFLKFNAITGTIVVALVGLLGTAIAGLIQARSNYRTQTDLEKTKSDSNLVLERRKFESDLILKAIETGGGEASTRNLLFLLKAGFIEDPDGKLPSQRTQMQSLFFLHAHLAAGCSKGLRRKEVAVIRKLTY